MGMIVEGKGFDGEWGCLLVVFLEGVDADGVRVERHSREPSEFSSSSGDIQVQIEMRDPVADVSRALMSCHVQNRCHEVSTGNPVQ